MGAFLDKPNEAKDSHLGAGEGIIFASSAMQGWRAEMEDAHTAEIGLAGNSQCSFFAVFDGHGGNTVANESARRLLPIVERLLAMPSPKPFNTILEESFLLLDEELRKIPELGSLQDRSGSTATAALITERAIFTANCGDSRSVLVTNGRVRATTVDHKPTDKAEQDRIQRAGGSVDLGRVCGNLSVSRSLGDFFYKERKELKSTEQKIIALPDVCEIERLDEDEFLVLACDGVWDVMKPPHVASFVRDQLKAGCKHKQVAENLLTHCLQLSSKDNISAIIVFFANAPRQVPGFQAPPLGVSESEAADGGPDGDAGTPATTPLAVPSDGAGGDGGSAGGGAAAASEGGGSLSA